ncbi:transposase [Colletotrichum chrysophilum]|uniref:Transposase n=1 Tax=Colletotrichum chrysophilum TaxID=1836956 RepID=A0AAD9EG63_9PEZI|nr:transposase [Colletotrichum chrysophilum]
MNNRLRRDRIQPQRHKLDPIEEKTLLRYVIEQDSRGFPLRLASVEDMANLLLRTRNGTPVGKHWAKRFIDSQPTLKTNLIVHMIIKGHFKRTRRLFRSGSRC